MNTFNHYAYGAIGDWMYRVVAGIEIGAPGYKHILIQPHPDQRLSYAKASYESGYGTISSSWKIKDGNFLLDVTIPPNTTSTITLPFAQLNKVNAGGKTVQAVFKNVKQVGETVEIQTGSGSYHFSYPLNISTNQSAENKSTQ